MPVTFEVVRQMALALDKVEEGTSYGPPAYTQMNEFRQACEETGVPA